MVYKKFIIKNGKKFGPYYYESYRDENGKVKTRYLDVPSSKISLSNSFSSRKNIFLIALLSVALLILIVSVSYTILDVGFNSVSNSSLEVNSFVSKIYTSLTGLATDSDTSESSPSTNPESSEPSNSESTNSETPAENIQETTTEKTEEIIEPPVEPIIEQPVIETPIITNSDIIDEIEKINETSSSEIISQTNETIVNETISSNLTEEIVTNETLVTNETIISNKTTNVTQIISTKQYQATIGKPVKWEKKVKLDISGDNEIIHNLEIELPSLAGNISVTKINSVNNLEEDITSSSDISHERTIAEQEATTSITGNVIEQTSDRMSIVTKISNFFSKLFAYLLSITGRITSQDLDENITISVQEEINSSDEIVVEYYTEAPYAEENLISSSQKNITIVGPEEVHYEDILAYSELPSEVKNNQEIRLYWIVNETRQEVNFDSQDLDGNGLIDTIEWIVPHLSNQSYEIILITKAERLDLNRTFVENIYDSVKTLDDNVSLVNVGEYVRTRFEQNLNSTKDITIYARATSGTGRVEVYEKDKSEVIATFENITSDVINMYKIYLTNLNDTQDVFDLKVLDSNIEFDYIVDPTYPASGNTIYACGTINESGTYILNQSISSSQTCMNITSDNVTLDGNGFSLTSTSNNGIDLLGIRNNITIKNFNGSGIINGNVHGIRATGNLSNIFLSYNRIISGSGSDLSCSNLSNSIISNNRFSATYTCISISSSSINNIISNNNLVSSTSYGLLFATTSTNNTIFSNNITTSGVSLSFTASSFDNVSNNNLTSTGDISISFTSSALNNVVFNNKINSSDEGIIFSSVSSTASILNNVISNNLIISRLGYSVSFNTNSFSSNNTLFNNAISALLDLYIKANANLTLTDQPIKNYNFSSTLKKIIFKDSNYGIIDYHLSGINGSGINLSSDLIIGNNFAYVNSSKTGLNKSANVTFYNLPTNFSHPEILKDGQVCTDCYNFTSLNAGNVTFNVTGWSNYSIGEDPNIIAPDFIISQCGTISSPGYYQLNQSITVNPGPSECIVIGADNVILDGSGYFINMTDKGNAIATFSSSSGLTNVTIKNLVIYGATAGIDVEYNANNVIIQDNNIYNSEKGIFVGSSNANNNLIENNTIDNIEYAGIYLVNGENYEDKNNTIKNNHITNVKGDGIYFLASGLTVFNNTIINTTDNQTTYVAGGIRFLTSANINISHNNIYNCYQNGIWKDTDPGSGSQNITLEYNYIDGALATGSAQSDSAIYFNGDFGYSANNINIIGNVLGDSWSSTGINVYGTNHLKIINNSIITKDLSQGGGTGSILIGGSNNDTLIQNNIIETVRVNSAISIFGSASPDDPVMNTIIAGNNILNVSAEEDGIYMDASVINVSIKNNYIHDNPDSPSVTTSWIVNNAFIPREISFENNTVEVNYCSQETYPSPILYPAYFKLTQNITGIVGTCFEVNVSNTIIDGNGYKIEVADTSSGLGSGQSGVKGSGGLENITVKNFADITGGFSEGIWLEGTINNVAIENNTISNQDGLGDGAILTTPLEGTHVLNLTIKNNLVRNAGNNNINLQSWVVNNSPADSAFIINNTFKDSGAGASIYFNDVLFENNTLTNTSGLSFGADGGERVSILNNIFNHITDVGIYIPSFNNGIISNNYMNDTLFAGATGIQVAGNGNNTIYNNTVENMGGSGIWFNYGSNWNVSNNRIENINYDALDVLAVSNMFIENNYFGGTNNGDGTIFLGTIDQTNSTIRNNIFNTTAPPGQGNIFFERAATNFLIENNLFNTIDAQSVVMVDSISNFTIQNNNFIDNYLGIRGGVSGYVENTIIKNNTFQNITTNSIELITSANNNLFDSNSFNFTTNAISLPNGGENNTFLNNNFRNVGDMCIFAPTSLNSNLIYNNLFGQYELTNETLRNALNLDGGGREEILVFGHQLNITNNSISFDPTIGVGELNTSANLTLNLAGWNIINPQVLKNGVICAAPNCNILSYNLTTGIIVFNVTSFSNYSIREEDLGAVTGCVNITSPGVYILQNDITSSVRYNNEACIHITSGDVVFDGNGKTITLTNETANGIDMREANINNVTIKNTTLTIEQSGDGIYATVSVSNISILNNNLIISSDRGIMTSSGISDSIISNNIINSSDKGIYFDDSPVNNIISNNNITSGNDGIFFVIDCFPFNNTISGNIIQASGKGLSLGTSESVFVFNNTINSTGNGVYFDYSLNDRVIGNNINSSNTGINLSTTSINDNISGNNITTTGDGISIVESSFAEISNNFINNSLGSSIIISTKSENDQIENNQLYLTSNFAFTTPLFTNGSFNGNYIESSGDNMIVITNSDSSNITNNIATLTTGDRGIVFDYSFNNLIFNNTISSGGAIIYLGTNSSNDKIIANNLISSGDNVIACNELIENVNISDNFIRAGNNGIFCDSVSGVIGSDISGNNITASGNGIDFTLIQTSTISENNITSSLDSIYTGVSSNNAFTNNNINSSNSGINFATSSTNDNILNNNLTNGGISFSQISFGNISNNILNHSGISSSSGFGLNNSYVSGNTLKEISLVVSSNNIFFNNHINSTYVAISLGNDSIGIFINNTFSSNTIYSDLDGIGFSSAPNSQFIDNKFINNFISAGSGGNAIFFPMVTSNLINNNTIFGFDGVVSLNNVSYTNISNNNIIAEAGDALVFWSSDSGYSNNNMIFDNNLNASLTGLSYYISSTNDTISNNTIISGDGYYNLYSEDDIINMTIKNQIIATYNLGNPSTIIFENSSSGKINFNLQNISETGINLIGNSSSDIIIGNNLAYVNSSKTGLNKSANVTLYNLPTNFSNPKILRDGLICLDCYNFTSLNAGNVTFNVTGWSNYSIGEGMFNVNSILPLTDYSTTDSAVVFSYNASSQYNVTNCSLFINNNRTNISLNPVLNSELNLSSNLDVGNYIWNIRCFGDYGTFGISENRTLTITPSSSGCSSTGCSSVSIITCGSSYTDNCGRSCGTGIKCDSGFICSSGSCVPACTDECTFGAKECLGSGYRTCGNYDSDSCLEWSSVTSCGANESCSSGVCESDICTENWNCGPWTTCLVGTQSRVCSDINNCGTLLFQPIDTQNCTVPTCTQDSDCLSSNPCSSGSCSNNVCVYRDTTNFCDDNNLCTIDDVCSSGFCKGVSKSCELGFSCEYSTGNCKAGKPPKEEDIPKEINNFIASSSCNSSAENLVCGDLSPCEGEYDVNTLLSGQDVIGQKTQTCSDTKKCMPSFTITKNCSLKEEITVNKSIWCNQSYTEIRNKGGNLLARISGAVVDYSVNVSINLKGQGYCRYCYNQIKDYDETDVDCGGSCESCELKQEHANLNQVSLYQKLKSWIALILVLIFLASFLSLTRQIVRFLKENNYTFYDLFSNKYWINE